MLKEVIKKVLSEFPFTNIAQRTHVVANTINDSAMVTMMKMAKNDIFHPIFDKELVESLATQEGVEALEIWVVVKKVLMGDKMHSNNNRTFQRSK